MALPPTATALADASNSIVPLLVNRALAVPLPVAAYCDRPLSIEALADAAPAAAFAVASAAKVRFPLDERVALALPVVALAD